jgi:hypothetical protein
MQMGIEVRRGDPRENLPGHAIVLPEDPTQVAVTEVDLDGLRRSYLKNSANELSNGQHVDTGDLEFLAAETRTTTAYVKEILDEYRNPGG